MKLSRARIRLLRDHLKTLTGPLCEALALAIQETDPDMCRICDGTGWRKDSYGMVCPECVGCDSGFPPINEDRIPGGLNDCEPMPTLGQIGGGAALPEVHGNDPLNPCVEYDPPAVRYGISAGAPFEDVKGEQTARTVVGRPPGM